MKRLRWVLLIVLLLPVVGMGILWLVEPYLVPPPAPFDVSLEPVELLPSGTIIKDSAPEGWTHLIIKSRPIISSGAIDKLSEEARRYATFLFMTTVARVKPHSSGLRTTYTLDAVAVGVGTTVDGKDMVLAPDSKAMQEANLGLPFRLILRGAYNKQQEVQMVVRSPTFALVDTPALMLRHEEHRDVILRYAYLVDRSTGRLDTLVWLIDRSDEDPTPGPIEVLSQNHIEGPPLHIDGREFWGPIPKPTAYAAERLPTGEREFPIPTKWKTLLGQKRFDPEEARQIDHTLRELLHSTKP
jgi:hypothetical protein